MAKMRPRLVVVTILIGLVLAGIMAVILEVYRDPFDDRPFDPAAWTSADSKARGPMARDAIRHLRPGLPAARVRELLGSPDPFPGLPGEPVDGFGNPLRHPETWAYYLGCWSGLGPYAFDAAFLYVHFGADGTVAAAEITGG